MTKKLKLIFGGGLFALMCLYWGTVSWRNIAQFGQRSECGLETAWQDGKVDGFPTSSPRSVEEPVSRLLPFTGLVGVRYDTPSRRWWAEANVQITDRADRLSAR